MASNGARTLFGIKRLIGRILVDAEVQRDIQHWPFRVISDERGRPLIQVEIEGKTQHFRPEAISAMILRHLKKRAETIEEGEVGRAVVTVPAYFNMAQRNATKIAARVAGFKEVVILCEPTAAAVPYGLKKAFGKVEKNIVVFDLGGGTFDVTVLNLDEDDYNVKAVAGDAHLGGEDLDILLIEHCIGLIEKAWRTNFGADENRALLAAVRKQLRPVCEQAKCALSTATKARIEIDVGGRSFALDLYRSTFEKLCRPFFDKLLPVVERALSDAKVEKAEVDDVVLVGGSTRVCKVREMLRAFFDDKKLCEAVNVDEAVACGAAVQASATSGDRATASKVALWDVTPLALGIEVTGGLMHEVLPAHTRVPNSQTETFDISDASRESGALRLSLFEGNHPMVKDCLLLGEIIMAVPRAKEGASQVDVTIAVELGGLVKVTGRLRDDTKKEFKELTVQHPTTLSEEDITGMIKQLDELDAADLAAAEAHRKINEAKEAIASVLDRLDDVGARGSAAPASVVAAAEFAAATREWLDAHASRDVAEYTAKLAEATQMEASVAPAAVNAGGSAAASISSVKCLNS